MLVSFFFLIINPYNFFFKPFTFTRCSISLRSRFHSSIVLTINVFPRLVYFSWRSHRKLKFDNLIDILWISEFVFRIQYLCQQKISRWAFYRPIKWNKYSYRSSFSPVQRPEYNAHCSLLHPLDLIFKASFL